MEFADAHCHYQFAELPYSAVEQARREGVTWAMVNGSAPADWPDVLALFQRDPRNLPAFGLHPWDVPSAPPDWLESLHRFLVSTPEATLGEVGLDQWVKDHHIVAQEKVLRAQLAMAVELGRPVSIHCVKAIEPLLGILRRDALPKRGFLMHSWNGPVELVPELVSRGAYFSFSAHHLQPRKIHLRQQFTSAIPLERILIETDAPALCPAPEFRQHSLPPAPDGSECNHPSNLIINNRELAITRGISPEVAAAETLKNFKRLFLHR
ncbi:TatD family deoxyribonuclease [bacterium]|nr:TatD family deoxyribonuclease [bacterium]